MTVKVDVRAIKEKQKRMDKLKVMMPDIVLGATKKNAVSFINSFKKWIKQNALELEELAELTVSSKRSQGMKKPESPLYGKGDQEGLKSYSGMMRVKKINGGWHVHPSKQMHWSKKIALDVLFNIHEFGCGIKRGDSIIIIPERPALKNAHDKFFAVERNKPEYVANRIKMLSKRYLNTGDKEIFQPFLSELKKNRELHE